MNAGWTLRAVGVALVTLLAATPACAAEPLRSIAEIRAVPILEADDGRPVVVRGIATLVEGFAVIQDGDQGLFVVETITPEPATDGSAPRPLVPGAVVEVEGTLAAGGYSPTIKSRRLRVIEEGRLPEPAAADMARLFSGLDNGRRVALRGVVQQVSERQASQGDWWLLVVECDSRHLLVQASKRLIPERPDHLIDAEVEIVGIVGDSRNSRGEFIAPGITIGRTEDLVVLAEPAADTFDKPPVPLEAIGRFGVRPQAAHRLRTQGVVSFATPGRLFLQEELGGVRVDLATDEPPASGLPFQPGDRVDVAGFLDMSRQIGGIVGAVARKIGSATLPEPVAIQPSRVLELNEEFRRVGWTVNPSNYDGCLIRCQARVESITDTADGAVVALTEGDTRLVAKLPRISTARLSAERLVPGSDIEVTGIVQLNLVAKQSGGLLLEHPRVSQLELLVRDSRDITVVHPAPWWTPRRLAVAVAVLATLAVAAVAWSAVLRREVARQTGRAMDEAAARLASSTEYEVALRERSRIAADLHDTLLQTMTGIGYQLQFCRSGLDGEITAEAAQHLGTAERLCAHATRQLRGTVWSLRTMPDVRRPLEESLAELLQLLVEGHGVTGTFRLQGEPCTVDETVSRQLLLVVQEAVLNAVHHGHARRIDVGLTFEPAGAAVHVEVGDDGCGFAVGQQPGPALGHFGIQGMRERIDSLDGTFSLDSRPGHGTTVRAGVRQPGKSPAEAWSAVEAGSEA
ncbi:MAG: sensor histidine kinase [Planctomycetia bacterium]